MARICAEMDNARGGNSLWGEKKISILAVLFDMNVEHLSGEVQYAVGYTCLELRVEAMHLIIP